MIKFRILIRNNTALILYYVRRCEVEFLCTFSMFLSRKNDLVGAFQTEAGQHTCYLPNTFKEFTLCDHLRHTSLSREDFSKCIFGFQTCYNSSLNLESLYVTKLRLSCITFDSARWNFCARFLCFCLMKMT